jgi:transposase
MTMLADHVDVVIGVDTHKHTHTAAVVGATTGAVVETITVPADPDGYAELIEMAERHAGLRAWAIEGTGTYGAGLTRELQVGGETVLELDRPKRPPRRMGAKNDELDAVRTARDALSREHNATPRQGPERAALSVLLAARRSAVDAAKVAHVQLQALICAAPEPLRAKFRGQSSRIMAQTAARLRVRADWDLETRTYAIVLRDLARRRAQLLAEAKTHEGAITATVAAWRPDLLDQFGVGPIVAATVLCAWSHPGRCRNEGAFAKLAGVAPIPASTGITNKHRYNPFGDRQLNRALHLIVIHRLRRDPTTRAYAERRRAQGKTDREIRRCLKRYVARQLYRQLEQPLDSQ